MQHIFKRKIYDKMLDWKQSASGETALLIQGARRVGKSTIAEQFAKNEYENYILIDFTKCSKDIKALFDDLSDLDYIFNRLQVSTGKSLVQRKIKQQYIVYTKDLCKDGLLTCLPIYMTMFL